MNKVFKVICHFGNNAYVVVSEMAKSHGTKSCSTKKLLAMLIATGVMTCASMAPAMADNPAPNDLNVTIGKGAHVSVWNGVSGQTISGDIAVGPNAHAWNGEYTYENGKGFVAPRIGTKEYMMDFGQGAVEAVRDPWIFGFNKTNYKVADGSKIAGSIAIGKNTVARTGSVMLGDHSYTGNLGDIEINPANAMTYNDGIYSTTLGAGAYNSGSLAAVTGALSIASGKDTKNTGATIYGSLNSIESATSNSIYSGVASSVLGFANRTQNANAALIWGTGNEVTNSIEKVGIDTNWNNVYVAEAQQKAIEAMQSSDYAGGSVMAIGGGNKADYAKYSQLTGVKNKVTGTEAKAAQYDFVNGYQNTVTNASDVTVIGIKNKVTADGNKVIGDNHEVSGKDNVIFGSADQLTETTVNNAVVLGHNAKVTGEGGVALGAGSVADRANAVSVGSTGANRQIINVAAGTEGTDAVNVSQLQKVSDTANAGWNLYTNGVAIEATNVKPGEYVDFSGDKNISVSHDGTKVQVKLNDELKDIKSIIGAGEGAGSISFADGGKVKVNDVIIEKGGKITGVAAGTADTDAVNYGQLKDVKAEAGKHTTLSNGKNTTVESTVKDGQTDYKVNVAGDLTDITSVANGDSKINLNKDSIIISNGNKYFAITNSGIGMSYIGADYSAKSIMLGENGTTISGGLNVAGSKITGVAAGEVSSTSTDAINGSQLHAVKTELQTSDKHLVGNPASADSYYKPDANGDISLRVEDQNKNGYDVVIKDVASKAELGDVANRVTNVENKVTQIETDVTTIKTDVTTIKTDITTIKTDINNINTRVDNVEALAGKHTTLEKNGTNINVEETVVDGQKNYKVNLNKDITLGDENGNNVSISGTNGTITATGDITTANRINAANGGKLADIDVTGNKLSNGNSSITLDGTNVKVNDKVTVDKDGKISGVAKGDISNTSTDAVNGSQLYDTNTHITNVENQVISNSNRINQLGNRVNKVGAGAAALAALHPMDFDPDDKLTFSAGYGNYGGENAAAIGAYYRPDEKVMFSVAGTVGNGENMVNAGVSFALDRTNHVSNSRTALAREVIDLRGQLAVMGAKMAKMEKAFGMLDETKTKLFPDVPANHWAYEYIAKLAGNGYIEGYPDGNFGGDRLMTRYEFAAMLYRAIEKGAALEEKIIKEFEPELGRIRVDRISGEDGDRDKIERVRVNDTKGERDHYGNKLAK